jgi:hypothetical protein
MKKLFVIAAAAFAASIVGASAQTTSANVVGYVNKAFTAPFNYYLVVNPLKGTNNTLKEVLPAATDQTAVIMWDGQAQDLDPIQTYTYNAGTGNWVDGNGVISNAVVQLGVGFFVAPGSTGFTNTFVGEVAQGSLTNPAVILGDYQYTAVGSIPPIGGDVATVMTGFIPENQDTILPWDADGQDFSITNPTYNSGTGQWNPGYNFSVGEAWMYVSAASGVNKTWIRTFTVQ